MLRETTAAAGAGPGGAKELESCILELAEGRADAMEPLYRIANPTVYAYSLSLLKNPQEAEDAAQDCFVRAFYGAAGYRPQGKPMAWLMTIARNLCMERLREGKRRASIPEEEWENRLGAAAPCYDDRIVLEQCMRALEDGERQIVVMHAVGGMKHRETAELLGLPLATVLSKYSRAIKKLKAKLSTQGGI